jgi:hypothetical protein
MLDCGTMLADAAGVAEVRVRPFVPAARAAVAPAAAVVQQTAPASPARPAKPRNRSGERVRYRPGCRQAVKLIGRRKDRAVFLDLLARHGDPALAAAHIGLPLLQLYRYRDADPAFAAEWQTALSYAWERVESGVLAALLAQLHAAPAQDGKPEPRGGLIDSRLVLAILNGRDRPVTRAGGRPVDSSAVARLRAEIRALSGKAG